MNTALDINQLASKPAMQRFLSAYSEFDARLIQNLPHIYHENAVFIDPVHRVDGIGGIESYFSKLLPSLNYCRFIFEDIVETDDIVFVSWVMEFSHQKLARGEEISVKGTSRLVFNNEKIISHIDYYDMGAMLYEHVPVLGRVVIWLRKRLG